MLLYKLGLFGIAWDRTPFFDNKAAFQRGVNQAIRRTAIELVDTLGRSFSVDILRLVMGPSPARTVGPAIASMLIYLLMAVVLYVRPTGLFPAKGR